MSWFPPYGFTIRPESRLIPYPKEQAVLAEIAALAAAGRSLRAIAREFSDRGILSRSGRPFAPSTLWSLVRNRSVTNRATAS